jgi:cytochrome P450
LLKNRNMPSTGLLLLTAMRSRLYNLAAMPQYARDLREEAREAFAFGDGAFTTAAIQKLVKLDSFIKETMRFNPIAIDAFQRKALQPFSLPDGTLIPAGTRIAIAWAAISRDPEYFENPDRFDGYRFVNASNAADGKGSGTNQFVAISREYLVFGFGRHACPGRFFATTLIKITIATLLLRYDLRNGDGSKERYPDIQVELTVS